MTEGPYKLPEGWRWVRLGEVVKASFSGGTPSTKVDAYWDGDIPWTTSAPIAEEDVFLESYLRTITREGLENSASRIAPSGSLIVATRVGVGKAVVATFDVAISQDLTALVLCEDVNPVFLAHLFKSGTVQAQLRTRTRGTTIKGIPRKELLTALIPLPPLNEQRRIVAKIEALMARIREAQALRREAQKDAERLMQAALAEVFPHPGTPLPPGWRWVRLGEIFTVQQGASMSPRRRAAGAPTPFLRTKNIRWGFVDVSSVDEMGFTNKEVDKLRLQPGDLLICEGGDVGRAAVWKGELPLCLYQNHIHRLRATSGVVEPTFYMYWMQVAYQIFGLYQGTESKTAIPNLSGHRLQEFIAPLPPLDEQRRIVAHLNQVQQQVTMLKQTQAKAEAEFKRLEQAILDKAFRGEL